MRDQFASTVQPGYKIVGTPISWRTSFGGSPCGFLLAGRPMVLRCQFGAPIGPGRPV